MNLTVSLGTTQQHLHPRMRNEEAVIGTVQLQQSPEGLFVIGDTRQQMQMGLAEFNNMALQPVSPPISNKDYEFRSGAFTLHIVRPCTFRMPAQAHNALQLRFLRALSYGATCSSARKSTDTTVCLRHRFLPAWGPGNDLLRQVKPVTVLVKLMRCTLGMHMTVSRNAEKVHYSTHHRMLTAVMMLPVQWFAI